MAENISEKTSWQDIKDYYARGFLRQLYSHRFLMTIFSVPDEEKARKGWHLKKKNYWKLRLSESKENDPGDWSPIFLNLRDLGKKPFLFVDICDAMVQMFFNETPVNNILGVDMAGIPIAVATSVINAIKYNNELRFCYTRPLPEKARTPEEAGSLILTYGHKSLVEGEILEGDQFGIWDDMVTDSGSKIIADFLLRYEARRRGVENIKSDYVAVVLDREQGASEQLADEGKSLHSLISLKTQLFFLRDLMQNDEFALVADYLENEESYQSREAIEWVLKNRKPLPR